MPRRSTKAQGVEIPLQPPIPINTTLNVLPPKPKVIGIVGSRRRDTAEDYQNLCDVLWRILKEGDRLVSGGCKQGADAMAEKIARAGGLTLTIHYADWDRVGNGAGFVRNTKIAEDCDVLIALVAPDRTGGTEDTVRKCRDLGKPIIFVE